MKILINFKANFVLNLKRKIRGMWNPFARKKKQPTVSEKLEETINRTMTQENFQGQSFYTMQDMDPNDISELETGTMSDKRVSSQEKQFINLMEVLNNPENKGDLLSNLNAFLSSNFSTTMSKERKLAQAVAKSITADSFTQYNMKIGKVSISHNR